MKDLYPDYVVKEEGYKTIDNKEFYYIKYSRTAEGLIKVSSIKYFAIINGIHYAITITTSYGEYQYYAPKFDELIDTFEIK